MKRIILLFVRCIFILPVWFIKSSIYLHFDKYDTKKRYALAQNIAMSILKKSRVTLNVYNTENIPKEDGYVLYPNHQGLFDSFVFFKSMDAPFTIIIKKEMRNLPLLKNILDLIDATALDREDIRQNMKVIQKMSKDVQEGRNYVIFAEGTRSKNGNKIGTFKPGSFKAATKAKAPIVPVALIDCFKPFDTNTIKKVSTSAYYLEPIYYDEYKDLKTSQIASLVEDRIQTLINNMISQNK